MKKEQPAFEIRYGKDLSQSIQLYEDGSVLGLGKEFQPFAIINRIPQLISKARYEEQK